MADRLGMKRAPVSLEVYGAGLMTTSPGPGRNKVLCRRNQFPECVGTVSVQPENREVCWDARKLAGSQDNDSNESRTCLKVKHKLRRGPTRFLHDLVG